MLNMVSSWWIASDPSVTQFFSGHFSEVDFTFVFNLNGSTSLRMEGPPGSSSQVTGTFRDRDGVVFGAGCSATAIASRL